MRKMISAFAKLMAAGMAQVAQRQRERVPVRIGPGTPGMVVDWSAPKRWERHTRGKSVPVFAGRDRRVAAGLLRDSRRRPGWFGGRTKAARRAAAVTP